MNRASMCIAGLCFALAGTSCSSTRPVPSPITPVAPPTMADQKPRDYPGLHNVVAYHDGYYSGSVPEGAEGFDALAGMGIKTIISVDGAVPDIKSSKARGMRYIHLPIGYNGFDNERKLELVRATRDALKDGPVFVHCHHGKHRSAGAAGTVVASLGWASPDEMVQRMKVSGTAAGYKGLFACTANAGVLTEAEINAVPANFPSVQPPKGFVKSMVEVDERVEHLKAIEQAGWKTPADHPDLVPTAEAGRLVDLLRFCAEGDRARTNVPDFAEQLRRNSAQAQAIEDELAAPTPDPVKLKAKFAELNATCKSCHTTYRD